MANLCRGVHFEPSIFTLARTLDCYIQGIYEGERSVADQRTKSAGHCDRNEKEKEVMEEEEGDGHFRRFALLLLSLGNPSLRVRLHTNDIWTLSRVVYWTVHTRERTLITVSETVAPSTILVPKSFRDLNDASDE